MSICRKHVLVDPSEREERVMVFYRMLKHILVRLLNTHIKRHQVKVVKASCTDSAEKSIRYMPESTYKKKLTMVTSSPDTVTSGRL